MGKVYGSRIDGWLAVALTLPLIGSVVAMVSGVFWIGAAALVGYCGFMLALVLPIEYFVESDSLRVRAGLQRLVVPWDRLIAAELSSNPLSSPALSLRRIRIDYRKPNGKETFVLISPGDREAFLRDLAQASPRHELKDGRLIEVRTLAP